MPRPMRPRGSLLFDKPPLSLDDLVGRLVGRGLEVSDRDRARRYLQHIGYYRLSPYTIPFQRGGPDHLLREGTSFDDLLDLYVFDRALRAVVMDALERVEVAVRAALTDRMSTAYDGPHWYMDASHFRDRGRHAGLLRIVRDTCKERLRGTPDAGEDSLVHRSALEHDLTTYGSPELPPSWLMVGTLTIGQLTSTYRNLRRRADRTAVAKSVGLTAPVLESWMQTYVRVRNICAHHGRLWNVGLGVYPAIPTSPSVPWLMYDGAVQEAPLPHPGVAAVDPGLGFTPQQLGTTTPHATERSTYHESARHGRPRRLGRRPVLEPTTLLSEPADGALRCPAPMACSR